jgi:hypothetical protein
VTEEQRAKLLAALQNPEHDRFPFRTARDAAVEIERLAAELREYKILADDRSIDLERYPGLDPNKKNRKANK